MKREREGRGDEECSSRHRDVVNDPLCAVLHVL